MAEYGSWRIAMAERADSLEEVDRPSPYSILQSKLDYPDLDYPDFSIIRTFRLSGLFDYPDFFSGPVFFMNINKL